MNSLFHNSASPVDNGLLIRVAGISSAAIGLRAPRSRMLWREIDARYLDDGLPRGFLASTIVEVWVALRLNWA